MRHKRFAAPPFLFLGAAYFLHRFGGERERGAGTLKSGRGREGERCRKSFDLQNCNSTLVQSQTGERERRRDRVREKERETECVFVCVRRRGKVSC